MSKKKVRLVRAKPDWQEDVDAMVEDAMNEVFNTLDKYYKQSPDLVPKNQRWFYSYVRKRMAMW